MSLWVPLQLYFTTGACLIIFQSVSVFVVAHADHLTILDMIPEWVESCCDESVLSSAGRPGSHRYGL
jgi:hypothetical protein